MNSLVCIKQVPDTTEIKIDPVKKTLIRAGVPSIVNPYDAYALELAAMWKDRAPETKITVLSMGPEQAKAALYECLATGADNAYLVSGRGFGGSDTLATSYILSRAVKKVEETEGPFDLILCGRQAIDGDTAQVGPEMAEHLGLPQVTCALEFSAEDTTVTVRKKTDTGFERLQVDLPCLVTVTKTAFEPRYASRRALRNAQAKEITVLGEADLDVEETRIGLSGSPTKVKKTYAFSNEKETVTFSDETGPAMAEQLYARLVADKII